MNRQLIITEANNGYVIEVKERQNIEVFVETSNAKVIKLLKTILKKDDAVEEEPPF